MRPLAQMTAIAWAEARMHWRRGMIVFAIVMFIALLLAAVALSAMGRITEATLVEKGLGLTPTMERAMATVSVMYGTWPVAALLLIVAAPVLVADAVPHDRQVGVRELLDSLPLGRTTYLAGKLLGVWASLVAVLAGVVLLSGAAAWLVHGPYDVVAYLVIWLAGLLPLALYTAGMGALLAAGQQTRRRATSVGIGFAVFCVVMLVTTTGTTEDIVSLARPTHLIVLQLEQTDRLTADMARTLPEGESDADIAGDMRLLGLETSPAQVPLTAAVGMLQIGLVWLIVWGWMHWKENRL